MRWPGAGISSLVLWLVGALLVSCKFQGGDSSVEADWSVLRPITQLRALTQERGPFLRETAYQLKACVRDAAEQRPVLNEGFRIVGGTAPVDVTTDGDGCFAWTETITFHTLAAGANVAVARRIEARGRFVGAHTITFSVNPWPEGAGFVDTNGMPPSGLVPAEQGTDAFLGRGRHDLAAPFRATGAPYPSNLALRTVDAEAKSESHAPRPVVRFDITLRPAALRYNLARGLEEIERLPEAAFMVRVALFEREISGGAQTLLAEAAPLRVQLQNGALTMSDLALAIRRFPRARFDRAEANRFHWELRLRIDPVDPHSGLMSAEGLLPYAPGPRHRAVTVAQPGALAALLAAVPAPGPLAMPVLRAEQLRYELQGAPEAFRVDRHLALTLRTDHLLTLTPKLARSASFLRGQETLENLVPGERIRLRVAFAAAPNGLSGDDRTGAVRAEQRRFLSRFETEAVVDSHYRVVARVPVLYDFTELPYVETMAEVLVELAPLGDRIADSQLMARELAPLESGEGPLYDRAGTLAAAVTAMVPAGYRQDTYSYAGGAAMKPRLPWGQTPYELIVDSLSASRALTQVDLESDAAIPAAIGWERDDLLALLLDGEDGRPLQPLRPLGAAPRFTGFRAKVFSVVDTVEGTPTLTARTSLEAWTLTASFFTEDGHYERIVRNGNVETRAWQGGVMGYVSVDPLRALSLNLVNAGVDARYGWWYQNQTVNIHEHGDQTAQRNRIQLQVASTLYPERNALSFAATTRRCLLLSPTAVNGRAYLACIRRPRATLRERWYFVRDFNPASPPARDRRDLRARAWYKVIRGDDAYMATRNGLTNAVRRYDVRLADPIGNQGVPTLLNDAFQRSDAVDASLRDGSFPGVIGARAVN